MDGARLLLFSPRCFWRPARPLPPAIRARTAAIIDLQHRYVLAMDYFDADGYAAVFTEDGVLDWARGEVKGRAAIREFMASGTYDLREAELRAGEDCRMASDGRRPSGI